MASFLVTGRGALRGAHWGPQGALAEPSSHDIPDHRGSRVAGLGSGFGLSWLNWDSAHSPHWGLAGWAY